ncbi:MAG: hypothetical protein GX558_06775, partial [Clostridiales bacterium]|nr:hypothetical protein [Clostridiales bacterium]
MKQIISRVEVLSQDEILMIHRSALNLLSRTGFSAPNDECLRRAAAAGARVDEMGVVRLPNDVTEAMVSRMRSRGHQPAEVVPRLMGTISTQVFITDYRTRTRRYGTTDDILKGLRLADQLRNIPYANAVVVPADVDGRVSDLHAYQQIYTHSTKPGGTYVLSPQTAPFIMDMAEAVGTKAYYLFESV